MPNKTIHTKVNSEDIHVPLNQAIPTGLLVSELLVNAFKHAFEDRKEGEIEINAWKNEDVHLQISDNGIGLPDEFSLTESMGMQIVNMLSKQLDAEFSYETTPGEGTTFSFSYAIEE